MIHEMIRIHRISNRMTQATIARKLGISQNAYSKIERGASPITVDRLVRIARILDIDLSELLQVVLQTGKKR